MLMHRSASFFLARTNQPTLDRFDGKLELWDLTYWAERMKEEKCV